MRMRVLFVTSEYAGLSKVGGLGEVSADLPRAMQATGVDVRVMMPAYPEVVAQLRSLGHEIAWSGRLPARAGIPGCYLGETYTPTGTPLYLVGAPELFDRAGTPYGPPDGGDWPDNHLRFARLSLAAAEVAQGRGGLNWVPDLVHANDWPGGLAAGYLNWDGSRIPTVMTIHNIAYQGLCGAGERGGLAIPDHAFGLNGVEFHGAISFLKAGIFYSDHVSTVSPNYAREITTEALGAGLHGLLRTKTARGQVSGITNGIDESWDPASNSHLPHHFDASDLDGKRVLANGVREVLCLAPSDGPMFGVVSRLVHQKGLDLIVESAGHIVDAGGQIAILGMGDSHVEQMLSSMGRRNRNNIGVLIGYNEVMEHRILGGSDFCLMPSRFESCGLTQMHAQRYGALPIAHATGGLADTIEDGRTGFLFSDFSNDGLRDACSRAFHAFSKDPRLADMRQAAMTRDFSWSDAAMHYRHLYGGLIRPAMGKTGNGPGRVAKPAKEPPISHEHPRTLAA
jgi:starch synthase